MSGWGGRPAGRLAISMIAALALAAGCDGSEPASGPSPGLSTPNPTPATPSPTTPEGSPSPTGAALEDGRHFGYIQNMDLDGSPQTVVFDLAEFLTGESANQAAREDGVIGEGESVPNDYYIRNRNPMLRTLILDDGIEIIVVDWDQCCETIQGDPEQFAAAFEEETPAGTYRGSGSPYWLTVARGRVVLIEEQYLP